MKISISTAISVLSDNIVLKMTEDYIILMIFSWYTVKTDWREVFEKCFNLKQKCFAASEISHAVFHNSDTKCLDHPNSYLQLFG